ncbi:MAG: hypothetical protein CMO80_12800 [Verrucomicrobiales bacterium]|nr:hypothetical protein [Verrucomicrobiales bacterium]
MSPEPKRSIKHNTPPFAVGGLTVALGSYAYLALDLSGFDQTCAMVAVSMGSYLLADDFRVWKEKRKQAKNLEKRSGE